jgi:hypothetical protein
MIGFDASFQRREGGAAGGDATIGELRACACVMAAE